ncbi:facilitated trehalose transporter Tret1-like [Pararge aegeria]|uniref:facilitated trehalose transporter Tret1-like n=1 Tax=Pararge aegeria TaxID=116150 RepID=UPI0019D31138|nr:facilitated trehalose transporter Tret1-like [Pararge aegeria]XP_039751436.1 facilitated trehalose transporter Tret1-like [Pararge aegeria]
MKRAQALRQVLVVTGLAFCSLSDGFIFGQMSGMVDALSGKDKSIPLSKDEISWIASTINITCCFGFGLITILTEMFGRRKTITIITTPVLICWLMVYFAQDKYTLLASRVIVGASFGGVLILTYVNIAEYVAPSIRSLCLNLMSACGSATGTLLGHVLSLFLHWRHVALIGIIPTAISAILPLFWVESPSWLATKGRFKECETSFKKLRISNEVADLELKMLINSQRVDNNATKNGNVFSSLLAKYVRACKQKYYRRIAVLLLVICIYRVAAGRILFNTLIITMLRDITGTSDILLFTLLVDGCILVGAGISCVFVSKLQMRTLLFTSGPVANFVQITLALCLYLWEDNSFYVRWIKVSLIALYSILISAGPYAVLETLLSELHPLDIKASSTFVLGALAGVLQFLSIQLATHLFSVIGYHGVFIFNACIVFICLLYLYFYLPETKGRTLQEIQFYFIDNSYGDKSKMMNSEQQNDLLSKEMIKVVT